MRKIMRNMARANMRNAGMTGFNKKKRVENNQIARSYFSRNWRRWIFRNPIRRKRRAA